MNEINEKQSYIIVCEVSKSFFSLKNKLTKTIILRECDSVNF